MWTGGILFKHNLPTRNTMLKFWQKFWQILAAEQNRNADIRKCSYVGVVKSLNIL